MNEIERKANRIIMACAVVGMLASVLAGFAALIGSYGFAVFNLGLVAVKIALISKNLRTARMARRT